MDQAGLFISFEGGEGAGKSSLINHLSQILTDRGFSVLKTREPGGSLLSEEIRQLVLSHREGYLISPHAELLLFLAARAQHLAEKIEPALKNGQIVLCDRFNDSTVVYQGIARQLGKSYVQEMCALVCRQTVPHLTLFLDVDPREGLKRTREAYQAQNKEGQALDRIEAEALEFHLKVKEGFLELYRQHPERIKRIDANRPQQEVLDASLQWVVPLTAKHLIRSSGKDRHDF